MRLPRGHDQILQQGPLRWDLCTCASGRTALVHVRVGLTDMNDISCSLELRRVLAHRFQTLGICHVGALQKGADDGSRQPA